jgi:hypothetical protein
MKGGNEGHRIVGGALVMGPSPGSLSLSLSLSASVRAQWPLLLRCSNARTTTDAIDCCCYCCCFLCPCFLWPVAAAAAAAAATGLECFGARLFSSSAALGYPPP